MIWQDRWSLLVLAALAFVTELVEPHVTHLELFSVVYVGVFSTALSIFLVFRFNEAYERWWEARQLWGSLVNASRSFARQALTLLADDPEQVDRDLLVRRQIAFVHALRIRLRDGETPKGRAELEQELRRLLPDDVEQLLASRNVPNMLLAGQGERLAGTLRGSAEQAVLLGRFDETLAHLHDVQGACERIKNTAFPDSVLLVTRLLVWGLVVLLLLATVGPSGRGGVTATIAVCIMSMGYLWIDTLARDLNNPFDGTANDTPMTSLSVSIERDLRELLGETDLPEEVKPVRGILM